MAQRTVVRLTDDLDGSEAATTITFSFDGVQYEIDLNKPNAADLREAVDPYVDAVPPSRRSSQGSWWRAVASAGVR
jgi:hypothetical protein